MTQKEVWFYSSYYEQLKKFRKEKRITEARIIKMITEDLWKYRKPFHIPQTTEKRIIVKIKGDKEDFKELERVSSSSLLTDVLQFYIYNFMELNKNDTYRKTGKSISTYFTNEEMARLRHKAGDKKLSEYIKQEVLK